MFLIYLLVINLTAFCLYGADKRKAVKNKWRTPEAVLLAVAAAGGSVGAYFGMKIFHHKTKKKKFFIGIPFLFLFQIFLILIYMKWFQTSF